MYPKSSELKTGYGILCHNKGSLEAKFLRWVLGSHYNHLAVVAVIGEEVYVVEARGGQPLGLIPYERWCEQAEREVAVVRLEIPLKEVLSYCGLPYDYTSCLALLWQKFFGRWFGRKEGKGQDKIFCFEYYALLLGLDRWYMATPEDFNTKAV